MQPSVIAIGHYPPETPLTGLSLAEARTEAARVINAAKAGEQVKGLNTQKRERRQVAAAMNDAAALAAAEAGRFSFRVIAEKWITEKSRTGKLRPAGKPASSWTPTGATSKGNDSLKRALDESPHMARYFSFEEGRIAKTMTLKPYRCECVIEA